MLRRALAPIICTLALVNTANAQDAGDADAWQEAQDSGTSAAIHAFIEDNPDSAFVRDAKALMIDVLWVELTNPAAAASDAVVPEITTPVSFSVPLSEGSEDIVGQSLEQLIAGVPLFSPVEGLPEEYWQSQDCASCHTWEPANLCTQAGTYLSGAGAENMTKQHPYGGSFKQNLRAWAQGGCE